jgi:uracil-DNA glycosylase family 4
VKLFCFPQNLFGMTESKLANLEAWLRYADDLNLGPYYRDRFAGTIAATGEQSTPVEIRAFAATIETSLPAAAPPIAQPPRATAPPQAFAATASAPALTATMRKESSMPPISAAAPGLSLFDEKIENDSLDRIRQDIGPDCQRCKLGKTRKNIVFGVGNPKAELMFVGEGPGADEDAQGEPFVGRAGKLLTQMIEAMGLRRQDVYIANVVKCRPPENRLPERDEIQTCSPYLMRQIAVIAPKVIVCLGACSAQTLLQTNQGISKFRGEWMDFRGSKLMATYHPAYLLRNPPAKADVWKDLQKVMGVLGLQVKKRAQ